jgi:hypothetical protein
VFQLVYYFSRLPHLIQQIKVKQSVEKMRFLSFRGTAGDEESYNFLLHVTLRFLSRQVGIEMTDKMTFSTGSKKAGYGNTPPSPAS